MKKFFCQQRGTSGNVCGLECEKEHAVLEHAVIKGELKGYKLPRKPIAVKRVMWVKCPVHGLVVWEHMGHHVTVGRKRHSSHK